MRHVVRVPVVLAAAALLVGCQASSSAAPSGGSGGTTVNVDLQEFAIVTASSTAPAGSVTFHVTNKGPDEVHEFVIIKTDLDAASLPTDGDGAVEEEADGLEVIDEVEDLAVDATHDLTVDLAAGSYVLICNIVDSKDGQAEAHYKMGMRTGFTVE
ncbi:MAG TPA: hypothetical protein VF013_00280 [Candidatus Limnocylindria bacterium]